MYRVKVLLMKVLSLAFTTKKQLIIGGILSGFFTILLAVLVIGLQHPFVAANSAESRELGDGVKAFERLRRIPSFRPPC